MDSGRSTDDGFGGTNMDDLHLAGRCFQLWLYQASTGVLLIRSPADSANQRTIDVNCVGLKYLSAPLSLRDLSVGFPTQEEIDRLAEICGAPIQPSMVLILVSKGRRFSLVASQFIWEESDFDLFEDRCAFFAETHQKSGPPVRPFVTKDPEQPGERAGAEERIFQLWEWRVSHGSVLIRSPMDSLNSRNKDLVMIALSYYSAPLVFKNLSLESPTEGEVKNVERALGEPVASHSKVMILASEGRRFPVVAADFQLEENDREPLARRFVF